MSALTPTRPTFLRSPAAAMPCTTTQNTIGATIIEISLRKASLRILSSIANPGANTPSTTPRTSAAATWLNSEVSGEARVIGAAAGAGSDMGLRFGRGLRCGTQSNRGARVEQGTEHDTRSPPSPLVGEGRGGG